VGTIKLVRFNGDYRYVNPITGQSSDWVPKDADPIDDEAAQLSVDQKM